jgi:hypothetical protein
MRAQKFKGIKDLMGEMKNSALQKELIDRNVAGNWYSSMNVSNIVTGNTAPKNPMVYIELADIFNTSTEEIIKRFSYE